MYEDRIHNQYQYCVLRNFCTYVRDELLQVSVLSIHEFREEFRTFEVKFLQVSVNTISL